MTAWHFVPTNVLRNLKQGMTNSPKNTIHVKGIKAMSNLSMKKLYQLAAEYVSDHVKYDETRGTNIENYVELTTLIDFLDYVWRNKEDK